MKTKKNVGKNSKLTQLETLSNKQLLDITGGASAVAEYIKVTGGPMATPTKKKKK